MCQQQPMIYLRAVSTLICLLGTKNIENSQKHELVLCALLARALLACTSPKQTDALWELFSPKISQFFKTAVSTLEMDILTITMVKPCS